MKIIREHWGALLGAFVMTLLVSSPIIAFPFYADDAYRGINIHHFGSDEHLYLVRAKEVLEGKNLGQPILNVHKDEPDPTFASIEYVLLSPFILTGTQKYVDVPAVYNIMDFAGVFALVLILYALMFALTGEKLLSIATALFVIGGYSIVYNKALFYNDFNIYLRSIYPWGASVPFFLAVWSLYKARDNEHGARYVILAGCFYGFLFYDYFFAWTFASALGASLFVFLLVRSEKKYAVRVLLAGLLGLVLASPHLYAFVRYALSDAGHQLSYFLWSSQGHSPVMSLIGSATLLLFAVHTYMKRGAENAPFILACITAGWIALNQQIITGRYIQYGHYYWYFIVPCSIIVGSYLVTRLMPQKWHGYFATLLIVLVMLNTAVGQYRSFFVTVGEKMRDQDYAPLIEKLRDLPQGSVLMADDGQSFLKLVTIYTDKDLFWDGTALTFNMSMDYLQDVLVTYLHLNTKARRDPISFLRRQLDAGSNDIYVAVYEDIEGYNSGLGYYAYRKQLAVSTSSLSVLRADMMSKIDARYQELSDDKALRADLVGKGVRYILWDKRVAPEWDLNVLRPVKEIATSTDLELYELQ